MDYMKRKTTHFPLIIFILKANYFSRFCLALAFSFLTVSALSQTTSYTQFSNELQFARAISKKFAAEIYLGSAFSNTPSEPRILKTNTQRYAAVWAHYFYSPRWKFSSSLAYFRNKDVPDIGQYFSPEWRLSLQGTYYFHKTGYTLITRMRGEFRYMMNAEGVYEDKYRYRQMIKYTKPINGKVLRKGIVYFVTSEELLFKPDAKSTGVTFFDRNRFELGGGYLITDDFQLELTYVNEFLPRDNGNEMYNTVSLTATFNNPVTNLKKHIGSLGSKNVSEE